MVNTEEMRKYKAHITLEFVSNKYPKKLKVTVLYINYHSSNDYNLLRCQQYYNNLECFLFVKFQKFLCDLVNGLWTLNIIHSFKWHLFYI